MSKCRAKDPIAFFDSGFGGLSVLKGIEQSLPNESLLFFSDSARVPYGDLSQEKIIAHTSEMVRMIDQLGVKMIVIACHTASIVALEALRHQCSVPVIGISEVFLTQLKKAPPKKALLLGTTRTIQSEYYPKSLTTSQIASCACGDFVRAIEQESENNELLPLLLEKHLVSHKENSFDALLLACTHFPFIKDQILSYLGCDIPCIDPSYEVAKEIRSLLTEKGMLAPEGSTPSVTFYTTGDPEHFALRAGSLIGKSLSPETVFELIQEDEEVLL